MQNSGKEEAMPVNSINDGRAIAAPPDSELTSQDMRIACAAAYRKAYGNTRNHGNCAHLLESKASTERKRKTPDSAPANLLMSAELQWREQSVMLRASAKSSAVDAGGELVQVPTSHTRPLPVPAHAPSPRETDQGAPQTARAMASDMKFAAGSDHAHPTTFFSLHYTFKSWQGQPGVEIRFERQGGEKILAAGTNHAQVTDAMQRHSEALPLDLTLRFEGQQLGRQEEHAPWGARQEQEADER
ncbi:hypothetical protein OKW49_006257 [Paraburkholderia youngii]